MLFLKTTLARDNDKDKSTCTVIGEIDGHGNCVVTVTTEHQPKQDGWRAGPKTETFPCRDKLEASHKADEEIAGKEIEGYCVVPGSKFFS